MRLSSNIIKNCLFSILFLVLFLPIIQSNFSVVDLPPLKGAVTNPDDIQFSYEKWGSVEYQEKKENYLNSMFGLRSLFVRLNNQISYSLFKKAKANGVIIGKENYLYEINYISAYTGKDYLGDQKIDSLAQKLKFISDTLKKLNKELIILFAPGKASFYPEYIPDIYLPVNGISNYKALSSKVNKLGINSINFNEWFIENKHKAKYPLYPQHGVHWSLYGSALACDSLIKYIENLRKTDLPDFKINGIRMDDAKYGDYDIADGMNLLFKLKSFELAYPNIEIGDTVKKSKPKVLVVSDSFYWGMYDKGISNCFSKSHFWYYNKQVYPESSESELLTSSLNFGEELNKHEIIIIMASETTINNIGWGFIEQTESYFKGNRVNNSVVEKDKDFFIKWNNMKSYIKNDKAWMKEIKKRAKEKNLTVDSIISIDAIWQIENNK